MPKSKPGKDAEGPKLSMALLEMTVPWIPHHPISSWKTFVSPIKLWL